MSETCQHNPLTAADRRRMVENQGHIRHLRHLAVIRNVYLKAIERAATHLPDEMIVAEMAAFAKGVSAYRSGIKS